MFRYAVFLKVKPAFNSRLLKWIKKPQTIFLIRRLYEN
jgi:hypothetical protein